MDNYVKRRDKNLKEGRKLVNAFKYNNAYSEN